MLKAKQTAVMSAGNIFYRHKGLKQQQKTTQSNDDTGAGQRLGLG